MGLRLALGAPLLSLALFSTARANLLTNGGLEKDGTTPINQYNLVYVSPTLNSTALPGWTVTSGTVDIVPNSYWQAAEGGYSVDMVGTPGVGTIQQVVATTPATAYTLTFDLAANPEAGPFNETGTTKILQVAALAADGTTVLAAQEYQVTKGSHTLQNMGWATQVFLFTATGDTTTIQLSALTPLNLPSGATAATIFTGPAIDNLNLFAGGEPAPEPASLGLLGAGVAALLLCRRRSGVRGRLKSEG